MTKTPRTAAASKAAAPKAAAPKAAAPKAADAPSASAQRRERERRQMRARLLEAAREIAAEDGWNAVTIRGIATRLEYAPPILYQHFSSKEALLTELMAVGFAELAGRLRTASDGPADGRLTAMAEAYWTFAFASPELYQAMNGMDGVPFGTADTPQEAKDTFRTFRTALEGIAEARGAELADPVAAADTLWALLHGSVSLAMAGRIAGGRERARTLMLDAVEALFTAQLR
ncbi:TetR/AcrR family transcriptional regulator [Actinomadura rupiterrae]|uniref:TetR/AcrR family transcriptional regulator n=1 Tax=Actinomadura rupiterrae TaxID=559627 RepID=UPI0020A4E091|nr:TetR/AcrR family transcriptional regulator [Actinomadura rupiterrae]MCP2342556.1 AcrR family transcriptional regulator [Actinomadura rupiterrae]